jgi:hypothetical protein
MVTEQLIVNGVDIPLEGSLNPNLTYSIQDIKRLDKRKATYSKTITLPSSKVLNDLFNFIFEINIDGTFNPNLKADAVYLVDSQTILNGFIKLNSIDFLDNSMISYKCTLLGSTANFFTDLGEKELTDIQGLGDFNHRWNDIEQRASWDTSIEFQGSPIAFQYGRGYTYPLIDYGKSTDLETFLATDLYPSFYVKELWDRIFTDAGFTYTSNFLSSAEKRFKQAIIPFNGDKFGMNSAQIADRMFTADTPSFSASMTNIGAVSGDNYTSSVNYVDVSDPANLHNAGVFTVPATGRYNVSAAVDLTATFKPLPLATVKSKMYVKVTIGIVKVDGFGNETLLGSKVTLIAPDYTYSFAPASTYTTTLNPTAPDNNYCSQVGVLLNTIVTVPRNSPNPPNRLRVDVADVDLFNGNTIKVIVAAKVKELAKSFTPPLPAPPFPIYGQYFDPTNGNAYNGVLDLNIVNTGLFKATQVNTEYAFDDMIDMYGCLPRKIKQKDFVMSIINMFNLFVEPDINNPNNLNIEPREDFYNTEVNDWSKKLDVSNSLMYEPMGLLDASRYIFSYKADKDYYNEKYVESYDDIYGQREIIIDNEFLSNTNTNKIIFSPTPLVGQSSNDRVLSTIIKVDQYQQSKPTASNIRYLIYDGLKDTSTTWIHESAYQLQYPYAGHFDDPFTPTVDVNFGLPFEIYYDATYYPIVITNNNLYNEFHDVQIEEITDKDSKVVKGKFYLTPNDISTLSFKGQYFFNNAYHRLLKVDNYNPSEVALTKCEFLKLKTKDKYTAGTIVVDGGIDTVIGNETVPKMGLYLSNPKDGNSYNTRTTNIQGANNIVDRTAKNVEINGDSNVVSSDTKNIVIQNGSNNTIEGNIENITLINTSNVTVTESNVTYINGQKRGGDGILLLTSGSYTQDLSIAGYEADCTSGLLTIDLLDGLYEGYEQTFKKVAGDFDLVITSRLILGQVESDSSIRITKINDSVTLYYNGVDYNIK